MMVCEAEKETAIIDACATKREVKRMYLKGEIGLPDAIPLLMHRFGMDRGQSYAYLGL